VTRIVRLVFSALILTGIPTAAARAQSCTDARLTAANQLRQAKLFDRAEAQSVSLLTDPQTAPCAARMLRQIANDRKSSEKSPFVVRAKNKIGKSLLSAIEWLLVPLAAAALIAFALGIARVLSAVRRRWMAPRWHVRSIAKDADCQVIASWRAALLDPEQRGRAQIALLVSRGIQLPRALLSGTSSNTAGIDLLKDAPEVQGLKLSWIGALFRAARWVASSPRRTVAVWATVRGQSAMMRVEAIDAKGNLKTTSLSTGWASDELAAREIETMAAAMALRTNYLLADESSTTNPTARGFLHEGLERLGAYASGAGVSALSQAITAFNQTRRLDPADAEALLYEGIAHELLEEHDLAQALFRQAEASSNKATAGVARFNRAISDLRRYTPEDIEAAVSELESIRAGKFGPELKAFASAAKASAIAHRFLFWPEFDPKGDWDFSKWQEPTRTEKTAQLREWSAKINPLLSEAERALKASPFSTDVAATAQLRWMISNARGNHELNRAAKAAAAYGLSDLEQKNSLEEALKAFRECEVLLPPGVETLTNVATVLIELARYEEAIAYARRARALNPGYEYAYYREAQAEQQRGQRDAAKAVLIAAKQQLPSIKIPRFRSLFDTFGVALDGG
jgi:tetratricopeptide (TPR) repeat protein